MGEVSPKNHTWSDFRDIINLKKPFMIVDFEEEDSIDQFINSELANQDYSKQKYYLKLDEKGVKEHPSVFIFSSSTVDLDHIQSLLKRFKIKRIIAGSDGDPIFKLYLEEGSYDFASDIATGLSPDDMDRDDYYKVGSMYYKFLN
jgi:hypothetical protein